LLQADRSILESCKQHLVPSDTLHIFPTNKQVDLHNNKLIATVCEVTETLTAQVVLEFMLEKINSTVQYHYLAKFESSFCRMI
jgi:hypothetical protein